LKSVGVDAMFIAHDGPGAQGVVAGCTQQGYKPTTVVQASTTSNRRSTWPWRLLKYFNLAGLLSAGTHANPHDSALPAVKEFREAFGKSRPGFFKSNAFAYDAFYTCLHGKLFEAAAKASNLPRPRRLLT
jgi:hypothetical protein